MVNIQERLEKRRVEELSQEDLEAQIQKAFDTADEGPEMTR